MDETTPVTVRVPSWVNDELLKIANEQQLDKSDIVRDALRSYIDAVNSRRCPECHAVNDPDSNFCKNCGKGLTVPDDEKVSAMIEELGIDPDNLMKLLKQLSKK
jgi:hypothetical protein